MQDPTWQFEIPDVVRRELQSHLSVGEQIVWLGRPSDDSPLTGLQRLNVIGGSVAIACFVTLGLLTYYWGFFSHVAVLIFIGVGIALGVIVGTLSNKQVLERFSTYVLTDKRAFSLIYDNEVAMITSVPLATRTVIESRHKSATIGTVTFSRIHAKPPELPKITRILPVNKRESKLSFVGVQYPQYVLQIALWAAAQNGEEAA